MSQKVLVVHNRYQIRGGEEEAVASHIELLRSRGHLVDVYEEDNRRTAGMGFAQLALRPTWSSETYSRLRRILRDGQHDVLDVHNTFPLISPSAYYAARRESIPVVQTLHNYRLVCPSGTLARDGHACEECIGKTPPWPGVVHACYRESRSATSVVAAMLTVHRLARTWRDKVDVYVALTQFSRDKLIRGGLPPDRLVVKPHFIEPDPGPGTHKGSFALYAGRLSSEKGMISLLRAWEIVGDRIPLRIVGDGPLANEVASVAKRIPSVEWLGHRPVSDVMSMMGEANLVLLPSECYENFPRVVVEAYARGTPAFASRIGALAELVDHESTGVLFPPHDPRRLADSVLSAWSRPELLRRLGDAARRTFERKYTGARNYEMVLQVYERAQAAASARAG